MPCSSFTGPRRGAASAREICMAPAYNSCPFSINNSQARLLPRRAMVAESVRVLLSHPYMHFSHPLGRCFAMPPVERGLLGPPAKGFPGSKWPCELLWPPHTVANEPRRPASFKSRRGKVLKLILLGVWSRGARPRLQRDYRKIVPLTGPVPCKGPLSY
eukprot:364944-Chlamydomonas_euryale.AAC.10